MSVTLMTTPPFVLCAKSVAIKYLGCAWKNIQNQQHSYKPKDRFCPNCSVINNNLNMLYTRRCAERILRACALLLENGYFFSVIYNSI